MLVIYEMNTKKPKIIKYYKSLIILIRNYVFTLI